MSPRAVHSGHTEEEILSGDGLRPYVCYSLYEAPSMHQARKTLVTITN